MKSYKRYFTILLGIFTVNITMAQENKISRRDLYNLIVERQEVTKVEIQEITLDSGLSAPKHFHPDPVFVLENGLITSIERYNSINGAFEVTGLNELTLIERK